MTYGERLRAAREAAGYTAEWVALKIGVSVPFYEDVEAGRRLRMSPERTEAVAEVLGIDPSELGPEPDPPTYTITRSIGLAFPRGVRRCRICREVATIQITAKLQMTCGYQDRTSEEVVCTECAKALAQAVVLL